MLEDELQAQVIELATMLGWLAYHTHDSRRSAAGFPDLTLVHPVSGALIFAELKRDGQHPTPDQRKWLDALAIMHTAVVWRPADLRDGSIGRVLHALARVGVRP